jgi:hypothetical protein
LHARLNHDQSRWSGPDTLDVVLVSR